MNFLTHLKRLLHKSHVSQSTASQYHHRCRFLETFGFYLDHKAALPFFTSSAVFFLSIHSPESRHWHLKLVFSPQFSVLKSQKLPNVRLFLAFCEISFIFVCATQPQFQSVCALKHLKTSACISARHKVCSAGVKMGVCPLYPPC